jgi:hypothetical protein
MIGDSWEVRVVLTENDEVVETIPCDDESAAKQVRQGVMINMNHADYRVETTEVSDE